MFMTLVQSPRKRRMGKWDLAFDSRRRSGPPSSFDTGPPLHPARRAPVDFILFSDSRLSYDRTRRFHFMIWAGLGPYLISHYARYLTLVSQGYSYCVLNCVQLFTECRAVACMCVPCFSNYFLASPFRSDRGVSPPSAQNSRSPTFSRRNSRRQPRPAAAAAVLSAGQLSEA
jgi:hypothetical protein